MIDREKNPVVPNPAPNYAFPFLAAEGFYISFKSRCSMSLPILSSVYLIAF